ncbi:MAG TPA: transglutaminase-like domain-containing protein, partial [Flavobacteriaceae bacterium]|nr:transglutaminase-like domain-containing protein [Flavobacteriaceae bacterium]
KGYTYTLENGKVEETKLKNDGVFDEKNNKYWATTKFTMPNIKEGCVIEFQYRVESPFMRIHDVVLQYDIPIKKLEFEVKIPEYFNFNKVVNPKSTFYPKIVDSKVKRKERITTKSRTGTKISQTSFETDEWEFDENKTEVNLTNVPALKDENHVRNIDDYRTKLIWEYAYYRGPRGDMKSYSTTWEKVSKTIYNYESFGNQLNKTSYFEDDVNALINGVNNPIERASLIYNFVKSKVKWNDFYGYTSDEGVRKAYKEGVGNVADINLMLTAMLRYANLEANPVLVSTINNGIPLFPTNEGFNYVISAIEYQNGYILLDATDKYATANILPERTLNWQGRLIREDGTSGWVSLMPSNPTKEIVYINAQINDDLSIDGKIRDQFFDYEAKKFRSKYNNLNEEQLIMSFEEDKGEVEISNIEIDSKNELTKPIRCSYEYKLYDAIEDIGGKLYFSPLLFFTPDENPFKAEKRNFPIDFVYPRSDKFMINLAIPEGYEIESLPGNVKMEFNSDHGDFLYLAQPNGNFLQVTISLNLNRPLILAEDYAKFKEFFQLMIEKQNEKIVLKKV